MTPAALIACRSIGARRRALAGSRLSRGVQGENILERADARAFRLAQTISGRGRFAKVAHGGKGLADVEDAVLPDCGDRGSLDIRPPDARRERAGVPVRGQGHFLAQVQSRHGRSPMRHLKD